MDIVIYLYSSITQQCKGRNYQFTQQPGSKIIMLKEAKKRITIWFPLYKALENANIHSDRKQNGDDGGIMTEGRIRRGETLGNDGYQFIILIGDDFKGV